MYTTYTGNYCSQHGINVAMHEIYSMMYFNDCDIMLYCGSCITKHQFNAKITKGGTLLIELNICNGEYSLIMHNRITSILRSVKNLRVDDIISKLSIV